MNRMQSYNGIYAFTILMCDLNCFLEVSICVPTFIIQVSFAKVCFMTSSLSSSNALKFKCACMSMYFIFIPFLKKWLFWHLFSFISSLILSAVSGKNGFKLKAISSNNTTKVETVIFARSGSSLKKKRAFLHLFFYLNLQFLSKYHLIHFYIKRFHFFSI